MTRAESERVFGKLLDTGEEHNLGGTGTPVAIVVIYPNAAFVKAGWDRKPEHVVQALMDALTDEARAK